MSQAATKPRPIGQQETSLSLDNTSHPGRPGLDELVPSRYALRVGAIDVLVISDGVAVAGDVSLGAGPLGVLTACWVRVHRAVGQRA